MNWQSEDRMSRADEFASEIRAMLLVWGWQEFKISQVKSEGSLRIEGVPPPLAEDQLFWFHQRGWTAAHVSTPHATFPLVKVAPIEYVDTPPKCYHTTATANVKGILKDGLKRGRSVNTSTSGWHGAGLRIHVHFDEAGFDTWRNGLNLDEAALLEINLEGEQFKLFRDPDSFVISAPSFCIEVEQIAPSRLKLVKTVP